MALIEPIYRNKPSVRFLALSVKKNLGVLKVSAVIMTKQRNDLSVQCSPVKPQFDDPRKTSGNVFQFDSLKFPQVGNKVWPWPTQSALSAGFCLGGHTWRRHGMETISSLLALCVRICQSPHDHWWFPSWKASNTKLWCFLLFVSC